MDFLSKIQMFQMCKNQTKIVKTFAIYVKKYLKFSAIKCFFEKIVFWGPFQSDDDFFDMGDLIHT